MLIGLDIHSDEIRLLQLKRVKQAVRVESFAVVALPPDAILDGKIQQFDAVISAIERGVVLTKTMGKSAAIALPAHSVISKRITLPLGLQEIECEAEIHSRLDQYLPDLHEELCFDFSLSGSQDALLVVSRETQLQAYVSVAHHAGLKVKVVDVDSYALTRAADRFDSLLLSSQITQQEWQSVAPRMKVSCGLALRDCPIW